MNSYDKFFVGGEWITPQRGAAIRIQAPASGETIASVPKGTAFDARTAIHAARWAFDEGPWALMGSGERAAILRRFALEASIARPRLTEIEIAETGCTRSAAEELLVDPPVEAMSFYADRAARDEEQRLPDHIGPPPVASVLRKEPIGVVSVIGASAEPLASFVHNAFVALAAGNTVVYKPSSISPLSALVMAECAERAGLPPGVLNVVTGAGSDLGDELAANAFVDAIALDGRAATARRVEEKAAGGLKRTFLNPGTGAIAMVLDGADPETVVPQLLRAWLAHQGQAAEAATRLIVDRAVHDELVHRLVTELKDAETGPLRSAAVRERVERLVSQAVEDGAEQVHPMVLTGVTTSMRIAKEEPGGPVLAVIGADDPSWTSPVRAAFVWAGSRQRGGEVARRVRAERVTIDGAGANPWARSIDRFTRTTEISTP